MRILHVITGLRQSAGTSVFVVESARQLHALGHDVSVLVKSPSSNPYPVSGQIPVYTPSDLPSLSSKFEVVHIHALWDPWLTRMARLFRRQGAKIVWSPHGMLTPWALRNKWPKKVVGLLAYQYWALRKADLLHATAESESDDVRRLGLKNDVVLAPLGVDVNPPGSDGKPEKYICFVSRIQRKKGLPTLLKAWAKMPAEVKSGWEIKIAGPDEDNHVAELKVLIEELKITGDIEFLGPVFDAVKDSLFSHAAFSVLPTYSENFGSVVIESLAQGTPVICTKGAPWRDLADHNCGWWIDIGVDPLAKALTEAMCLYDRRPDVLSQMGRNGLALVREKYTWESVARTMETAYANALKGAGGCI